MSEWRQTHPYEALTRQLFAPLLANTLEKLKGEAVIAGYRALPLECWCSALQQSNNQKATVELTFTSYNSRQPLAPTSRHKSEAKIDHRTRSTYGWLQYRISIRWNNIIITHINQVQNGDNRTEIDQQDLLEVATNVPSTGPMPYTQTVRKGSVAAAVDETIQSKSAQIVNVNLGDILRRWRQCCGRWIHSVKVSHKCRCQPQQLLRRWRQCCGQWIHSVKVSPKCRCQMLKDRIDASFRKAYRWKLTYTQYNYNDLLFDVDSKLFACSKSKLHCLHHMLPLRSSSSQTTLRPRGHSYDVPRVVLTKRSFILRSLYKQKSVLL